VACMTFIAARLVGCSTRANSTLSDNKAIPRLEGECRRHHCRVRSRRHPVYVEGNAARRVRRYGRSGKRVTIHEAAIYKVVAGKIVEQWGFPDSQSLMQQLMTGDARQ
jgi:SnoaL-like polyketide cyclase